MLTVCFPSWLGVCWNCAAHSWMSEDQWHIQTDNCGNNMLHKKQKESNQQLLCIIFWLCCSYFWLALLFQGYWTCVYTRETIDFGSLAFVDINVVMILHMMSLSFHTYIIPLQMCVYNIETMCIGLCLLTPAPSPWTRFSLWRYRALLSPWHWCCSHRWPEGEPRPLEGSRCPGPWGNYTLIKSHLLNTWTAEIVNNYCMWLRK